MPIRWDSLLVRQLAQELDERLRGHRLRAVRLDGDARDAVLLFREASLVWRLHPERSTLLVRPAVAPAEGDLRLKARLRSVRAPSDERLLVFELVRDAAGGLPTELVVELIGSRLNAVVVEGPERIARHVLVRREGARPVRVGHPYAFPPPVGREGADGGLPLARWLELLEPVPPPDRARALLTAVAWTSPINADAFLEPSLAEGHARWLRCSDPATPTAPCIVRLPSGPQPYGLPLPGLDAEPADSLVAAFERVAADEPIHARVADRLRLPPELLARLERAIEHAERRLTGLRAELDAREDPDALRAVGDLILARFGELAPGTESATLTGFDGAPVEVALDPKLPPHENAARYYDRATRSERAAERIPRLIEEVEARRARLGELRDEAAGGTVDLDELRRAVPAAPSRGGERRLEAVLPYRVYRSSGGLEIRVGRGARHNDDLTFRHSAPDDVWLHARHTAGAHVILRWAGEGNPPARDLEQAGVLAALHSKARTSGSVPVDWTRRKYVRKPRGSAPGSVVPDRVQTLFVRPDEGLLDALAEEP